MTEIRPPQEPRPEPERPVDELLLRYRQASDADPRRPASQVGEAVRAHAQSVLAARQTVSAVPAAPAANQPRWKLSLLASVVLAGLTSLLVLQFDRGPADERERVLGDAAPSAKAATDAIDATDANQQEKAAPAAPAMPVPARPELAQATPKAAAAKRTENHARTQSKDERVAFENIQPPAPSSPAQEMDAPATPLRAAPTPATAEMRRADEEGGSASGRTRATATPPLASALQEAARKGHTSQLNDLLARGAPLDAADTEGRTPLMLATIHNHPEMVQRLLAAGANVTLVDRSGSTALAHARRLGHGRIAELIEEAS
nr:ankyrin repeat domain-containing protein [uncultured Albidiferax sp.]